VGREHACHDPLFLFSFNDSGRPKVWAHLKTHDSLRAEVSLSGRLHATKKWINSYCRSHVNRGQQTPTHLPRRVLDLRLFTKSHTISLYEPHSERGLYVCLIYCWGPALSCQTTIANISSMMEEIPWIMLPQTFKNAILVASEFKIPYLWIDALCIIQSGDYMHDWEEQSAGMSDIYRNAFLTIAAANCTNP
jgi:Heterokaryon incompatibility protein (HET)